MSLLTQIARWMSLKQELKKNGTSFKREYKMENIQYIETDQRALDSISFLWVKLNEHHRMRSRHFVGHFAKMTWEIRKNSLLEKIANGSMRIDIAKDIKTGKFVGYCISTVNDAKMGELESIFIEEDYRRREIGDYLMKKALKWMEDTGAAERMIAVGAGNEDVFPFYARHGFFPRVTLLRPAEKD
jgi:GNAT superfamily N-acetyltransferase